VKKRIYEKSNAINFGFGEYNEIESIDYKDKFIIASIIDYAYDYRVVLDFELSVEELEYDDAKWYNMVDKLKKR